MTRHQTVTPSEQHTPSHGRTHPRTYYRTKERTQARGHTINARILSITLTHTNKITRRPQRFNNLGHTPSHSHNLTRTYTHTHTHAPNIHGNVTHTCTGTIGTGARSGGSSGGSAEGMRTRGWLRPGRTTRAGRTVSEGVPGGHSRGGRVACGCDGAVWSGRVSGGSIGRVVVGAGWGREGAEAGPGVRRRMGGVCGAGTDRPAVAPCSFFRHSSGQ